MSGLKRTIFYDRHVALGAKIVEFGGWEMPIFYPAGILEEHLATRKKAGLFDVSHMGRFIVRGSGAIKFLQHVLTNNAEALNIRETGAQYTLIPNETGGAVDDAYLYRFVEEEYLLVVNAANREKDWDHLNYHLKDFQDVELIDKTSDIAMLALQGPMSRYIMEKIIGPGRLPEPIRNAVSIVNISGATVKLARTGYTGEPLCFELFISREDALMVWDQIIVKGATPIGLGARDTLRLEAGLPLYGHELGIDPDGKEIPIIACPLAKFAVSFSSLKGNFIGRSELIKQQNAFKKIVSRDYSLINDMPRMIKPIAVAGRGIAREGAKVFKGNKQVGYITSGTMVPLWTVEGEGLASSQTEHHQLRSICLGYIDSDILEDEKLTIEIRGKAVDAVVVKYHMRSEAPPYARPIVFDHKLTEKELPSGDTQSNVLRLLEKTLENTIWRQKSCINLIPSEMTISPMARLLSVMDPAFRYAEHKKSIAFYDADIFYYQGTDFICKVEQMLEEEMRKFLGCDNVETRLISGQMANTAVFSAIVDFINRADRKSEPRRIRQVMHTHIGKGGHLSAQPMGALKDYVARDPKTERPAVVNFPVLAENPFKIDVAATLKLIDEYRPELIIFGKSMVIHKEPVAEIRQFLNAQAIKSVLMYDMAHVLGLIGSHFQQPFSEGADIVTGSTHKTFFGTQRGIAGSNFKENEELYTLWEALVRRTFPGSVSNHHLGTLLGLLMAAYEMNYFKDEYQSKVIANAKAFARALKDCGLNVAGDPEIDFTETHQVLVHVGYSRGPEIARQLEVNNIICNYQASTDEEGFTASGALRMGVSEMTRFGMEEKDFQLLAGLIQEVVINNANVVDKVKKLREKCSTLKFCFSDSEYDELLQKLHELL
ncbi:MAG: glycine cleavage system aminomethyltransferase GcvT [Proteobacteria bacterium]|nr:glycine cleavage system aminomethyltransferase GcvT [Pseudomonadota bacterium]MBU4288428.1 glycine cleavage system aminomethyltransferase GcvT [Pseudomonadota bacterium]MBU4415415.1 glycine cleavage system aminomethyltransferase GcvT [Pseudomonadota bacterium]MCG2831084.1 glycine cleavage system aminomethyltransferase GcvT [Desulfobacteraceae bacterium]